MRQLLPAEVPLSARTTLALSWQSVRPQWSDREGWKLVEAWSKWAQTTPSTNGGKPFVLAFRPSAAGGWAPFAMVTGNKYVRVCVWCCECDLQVANADDAENTVVVRVSDIDRPVETHNQMIVELNNGSASEVELPIPFGATSVTFDAKTGTSPGTIYVYNGLEQIVGIYALTDIPATGISLAGVGKIVASGFPDPSRFIFDLAF